MKIGIIGAGNVGEALARAWSKAGHDIILGVRDAAKAKGIATQTNAQLVAPADVKLADVIVLATPWGVSADVLCSLGDMSGRTIIDCTNPLGMVNGQLGLTLRHTISGAEELAKLVPNAHLVKTLERFRLCLNREGFPCGPFSDSLPSGGSVHAQPVVPGYSPSFSASS